MKKFASRGDKTQKNRQLKQLDANVFAYTAEGDPNSGVIIHNSGITIIEAQATPFLARGLLSAVRKITDKPIKHVILTHYHAVRTLGASAYRAEQIICSSATLALIHERGLQDWKSELQRFPRLFEGHEEIRGLSFPTLSFDQRLQFCPGNISFECIQIGKGHTEGDSVIWIPEQEILFAGDLVEDHATPYCGDGFFKEWPKTLEKLLNLNASILVPGRGDAIIGKENVRKTIEQTAAFINTLFSRTKEAANMGKSLNATYKDIMVALSPDYGDWAIFEHCMPFNVVRAWEEVHGQERPLIWTAEKDLSMWKALNE